MRPAAKFTPEQWARIFALLDAYALRAISGSGGA